MKVNVIGAGLAGSEAAWQLAKRGIEVDLYEMRPKKYTSAHKTSGFAELICSNSLRAASIDNAIGLLKEEMRRIGSIIMEAADNTRVEAGGALAVDRDMFSSYAQGKRNPSKTVGVARGHQRANTLKPYSQKEETQAGIKIARRNINNLRYADDTRGQTN